MGFLASLDRRRLAAILTALLIAFLTGHVMQNYLADDGPLADQEHASIASRAQPRVPDANHEGSRGLVRPGLLRFLGGFRALRRRRRCLRRLAGSRGDNVNLQPLARRKRVITKQENLPSEPT